MKFKKQLSVFLGVWLFVLNFCCCKADSGVEHGKNLNNEIKNIIFVPDEEIIIDSLCISACVGLDQVKQVKYVSPDKNSSSVLARELFPAGSPRPEEVQQGALGVCYFFAVLSTLASKYPNLIKSNLVEDGKGNVIAKFFDPHNGKPFYIKVQKTVPNLSRDLRFTRNDCLWVQMYLKAFVASGFAGMLGYVEGEAKTDYKSSEGGRIELAMRMLTGKDTETVGWLPAGKADDEIKLYDKIKKELSDGGIILCEIDNPLARSMGRRVGSGLVYAHAYSIEEVYQDNGGQKWVKIRNPWGYYVPEYGENNKVLVDISDENNGYFVLKFQDLLKMYKEIHVGKNEKIRPRSRSEILGEYKRFFPNLSVKSRLLAYLIQILPHLFVVAMIVVVYFIDKLSKNS